MTPPPILRMSLITRMQSARVIALSKGRSDLAVTCVDKIAAVKRAFDNELPMYVAGVEMIERECIDAITMDEVRARYRAFSSAAPCVGEPAGISPSLVPVGSYLSQKDAA